MDETGVYKLKVNLTVDDHEDILDKDLRDTDLTGEDIYSINIPKSQSLRTKKKKSK